MSWKDILKNDKKYPDNKDKFPKYIRVDGEDYKLSSFSGMGTTASYNHVDPKVSYFDGHLEDLSLEYALKHSIDSEYQKEIEEASKRKNYDDYPEDEDFE
tara:strand:+ start:1149 stop:1448 length:300 start_codon:yes stop_codon:yes gene_type:complete